MFKQAFLTEATSIANNAVLAEKLWEEIEVAYTNPDRHFHNLAHLEHLLKELTPLKVAIEDWPILFFSLCYHDAVYDVSQNAVLSDNEERSAAFAETHLRQMGYPADKVERCRQQIMATQKHELSADKDTNFLTDADLSILGQPWPVYEEYKNNIREEFALYPTSIYNAGRRKFLSQFLNQKTLFKTDHFRVLYEQRAKENMAKELQLLSE